MTAKSDHYTQYRTLIGRLDQQLSEIADAEDNVSKAEAQLHEVERWRSDIDDRARGWWEQLRKQLRGRSRSLGDLPEPTPSVPNDTDLNALFRSTSKRVRSLAPLFAFSWPSFSFSLPLPRAFPRVGILALSGALGALPGFMSWLLWRMVVTGSSSGIARIPEGLALTAGPMAGMLIAHRWLTWRDRSGPGELGNVGLLVVLAAGALVEALLLLVVYYS